MKPVFQDRFGKPAGKCWEACIASIIECDLSEVPYVRSSEEDRVNAVLKFLFDRGYQLIEVKLIDEIGPLTQTVPIDYYILCGTCENSDLGHTVVARGNDIIHNPNPNAVLTHINAYQIVYRVVGFEALPLRHYEGERVQPET